MSDVVLDAGAILAVILEERGAEEIVDAVEAAEAAFVSSVNISEVAAKLHDAGAPHLIASALADLELSVVSFDEASALAAGGLRPATRSAGLSLGDRACLALAISLDLPVITTDRAWSRLSLPVQVILAR